MTLFIQCHYSYEMNNKIQIKNLTIAFTGEETTVEAVKGISLTLKDGEVLGIVGESGSGKSVTSLCIMRLIPIPPGRIKEGEILFYEKSGEEVSLLKTPHPRIYRGKKIAMIFQEPMTSLNPVHRCGKQVMEMLLAHTKLNHTKAKQQTLELFNEVQLPRPEKIMRSYPHELSGGQRQRVMIAMALACGPDVLIADEPTTALDVTVQRSILLLLRQLQQKKGMSVIFISHDLGVIAQIADRVAVMYRGEIVEKGSIDTVFNNPQHPYTKGLLACRPSLDKRPKKLLTVKDFIENKNVHEKAYLESKEERQKRISEIYNQPKIMRVKNLSVEFIQKRNILGKPVQILDAVKNASFEIYRGETLGLVGESGCGKTTLGRALLRLVEPKSGNVFFNDKDVTLFNSKTLKQYRLKAQIIFQDPYSSLNPRKTVGSAITEPMAVHGISKNKVQRKGKALEILNHIGLGGNYYNNYPHELSGGQRQRVCIARALAVNPDFIICDESVSALDVSIQAQVLNLLNKLKKHYQLTYIFISHDLSVVKYISDRVAVMKDGEIIEIKEADELYKNPGTTYTQELIEAIP